MVIDYGSGELATNLENIINFIKIGMKTVLSHLLIIIFILIVLNILYEIFLIAIENEFSKVMTKIINELILAGFLFFIITNWLGGLNIMENILEPLVFERIPRYIFSFQVGGQPFFSSNGVLLNLDAVWSTLKEIPDRIYDLSSSWKIIFEWVLFSNLGFHIALIFLKMFAYVMIMLFFGDIIRLILSVHIMYIFSGITFLLVVFKPLRENYAFVLPKTIIATSIQYYLVFIVVGLSIGYLNYLYSIGGKLTYILGLLLLVNMVKTMMNYVGRIGGKL